jgi:hypothetical protein
MSTVLVAAVLVASHAVTAAVNARRRVDPDTSDDLETIKGLHDGRKYKLVMSDEFNREGREFGPGKDPMFEALEKPDDSNQAIQFYNASKEYATTKGGSLTLTTRAVKTSWTEWSKDVLGPVKMTKNYTSAMIQTWNKFCFAGGVLEMSIMLPGDSNSGGLWPAFWLMGNLARATFEDTTTYVWPWSYDKCGDIDHLADKQKINACDKNPGYGFNPRQGRGAPEIDIFEVMPGHEMPKEGDVKAFLSSSLQVSPGIPKGKRPLNGEMPNSSQIWYNDLRIGDGGEYNYGFWGQECGPEKDYTPERIHKYMQDAISINTYLNETHFDSHHKYRLEWQPGPDGYLDWYLDDELLLGIDGDAVDRVTGAQIPTVSENL